MAEHWKKVIENENYEVSDQGRVRRCSDGKMMCTYNAGTGYRRVDLRDENRKKKSYAVHRIEARAFLNDDYEEGLQVNHKDGDKANNYISNLEWCTQSENMKHAYRTGLEVMTPETRQRHRDALARYYLPVRCIENGKVYANAVIAARDLGLDYSEIRKVTRGVRKHARGYHFEKAEYDEINT